MGDVLRKVNLGEPPEPKVGEPVKWSAKKAIGKGLASVAKTLGGAAGGALLVWIADPGSREMVADLVGAVLGDVDRAKLLVVAAGVQTLIVVLLNKRKVEKAAREHAG